MKGRALIQYLIDTSDVLSSKKQEATEYLAKLEEAAQQNVHLTALRRRLAVLIFINFVLLAVVLFAIGGR